MAEFSLSTSNLSPKKRASFKRFKTFLKIGVAALAHSVDLLSWNGLMFPTINENKISLYFIQQAVETVL